MVVVSVGNRPWFPLARKWMKRYCEKYGIDLVVVDAPRSKMPEAQLFDRPQNWGRAVKYTIADLFKSYTRIIVLDDTCLISPLTENLFELVPEESIGCYIEGPNYTGPGFTEYLKTVAALYRTKSVPDRQMFFNGGMCVLSSRHGKLFELNDHEWACMMSDKAFPGQGYMCCKASECGMTLYDLGPTYNLVGSAIRRAGGIMRCPAQTRIFHLTSALKSDERLHTAQQLDWLFEQQLRVRVS